MASVTSAETAVKQGSGGAKLIAGRMLTRIRATAVAVGLDASAKEMAKAAVWPSAMLTVLLLRTLPSASTKLKAARQGSGGAPTELPTLATFTRRLSLGVIPKTAKTLGGSG